MQYKLLFTAFAICLLAGDALAYVGPGAGFVLAPIFIGLLIAGLATAENSVYPSAEAAQPLQPGAAVPSVSVHAVDGSAVDLSKLVSKSGALLVFYRGGW